MEDQEEYKKLPADEKCVHKLWKARVAGYEEVTKLFRQIDDEKSSEFSKYLGLVKKFVTDSNALGQEKGLEATLAYVENYVHAGKTVSEVMSGIVTKCIAAPKTKTRELALQLTLMYIEIEKQEAVQEELIKGMELKNPKIVAACVTASTVSLKEFGSKIVSVKPLLKKISTLLADRDKTVRDESKQMIVEMYRWIGAALRPQLQAANLQPLQITELESEFAKLEGKKAVPLRYIRSQQAKQPAVVADVQGDVVDEEEEADEVAQEIDPYELADPVEILSKLPKDFYEIIESKKWQERKEVLEIVETLSKTPKLDNGDYGDLIRALKKVIQKDSNVVCVAIAGRCLSNIAAGLKKKFQTYASFCIPAILEKFKEKKQNVVTALRDAIDAIYVTTTLDAILEDILEALNNKNPSVKVETSLFLARAFTKTVPTTVNKKLLKAITTGLIKTINESDPNVREAAAESLGTLMKLVGEKSIGPFLAELEKDNLKMVRIKEFCEKAVIAVKVPGVKKERPTTAPAKVAESRSAPASARPQAKKQTEGKKKPVISSGTATVVKSKGAKGVVKSASQNLERELSDEEVDEIIAGIFNANIVGDISSANWKTRLEAAEQIMKVIQTLDSKSVPTQAVIKFLGKKPGLKDTNFQVFKVKLDIVKYLAENCKFTLTTANCCVVEISEKFSDTKNGAAVAGTLTAISEVNSLSQIAEIVLDFAFTQKSPKVQQEALLWFNGAIREFGFNNINVKLLMEQSKKALSSINPGVRQAAITLLGTVYLYMGATLNVFFENEKPAIRDQLNVEFDKYEGEKPPPPTRGVVKSASSDSLDNLDDEEVAVPEPVNIQDLLPRVDISGQITEGLLNEIADKNWKVRNEALGKISTILQEAKFIKPNLGDLPQALATRLTDSNAKIAQSSLNICETIANAMGPPCKQYVRVFFPGFLQCLGDSKSTTRSASLDAMNAFSQHCGYKDFFESEMISDALKSGSPTLRIELWNWLAEHLPKVPMKTIPKEELLLCVPYLYSNLEDRSAEVRKNAQEAVLGIMIHLGYDAMLRQCEKLKPGSKAAAVAALEKTRPNLPEIALPPKKQAAASKGDSKAVRGTKQVASSKNAIKPKGTSPGTKSAPAATGRKKDDDIDTSPLLVVNNLKQQRTIDEVKLKVLKWNFTQPREEFVELLRDQMTTANVNRSLMANMFHADFRFHLKAIESLTEDLQENSEALIANLDLVLKWLTLRFFDTNPSVLLKGLEYLHSVFNVLNNSKYRMLENEASAFIPYLVLKIGDPKDTVRNGVKSLINQIYNLYPVTKMFSYVMEGIKSKNARQRAECLEVLGSIIENFGITACVPTPGACLKEVAKQISDRDNSVRNAALNCVLQAYNIVGEKVYKFVGNISDKDMSLLEERIKRSSRKTILPKPEFNSTVAITPLSPQREVIPHPRPSSHISNGDNNNHVVEQDDDMEEEENLPPVPVVPQVNPEPPKEIQGPFRLDPEIMSRLENMKSTPLPSPKLKKIDLKFLDEEIKIPTWEEARQQVLLERKGQAVSLNDALNKVNHLTLAKSQNPKKQDVTIERFIRQVASENMALSLTSLNALNELLPSPKGHIIGEYEDDFMKAITDQFRILHPRDPVIDRNVAKVYRNILTVMDTFYQQKFGTKVSVSTLKVIMDQLITLLVEEKMNSIVNGEAYIRVINLHCVRIMERSDHTNIICALVQLINEYIELDNKSPRHVDLVMKCLWRVIRLMPNWGEDMDYDLILLDVHNFLKKYPTSWWKSKETDTPLRTIKTLIHSCVKIKGATIMLHMGKISNTSESEVESYTLRVLKSLKMGEAPQSQPQPPKQEGMKTSLSRENHNMLTDIFQKIGIKDETTEGLNLLYDFLQQHPEADIDPFLRKSSKFFQDYIKSGLKKIEDSRKSTKSAIFEKAEDRASGSLDIDHYYKKLEMLKKSFKDRKSVDLTQ